MILGHTNEPEYRRLQNNEFMEALRDRTVKIDIPYVTRLRDEVKIYEKDFNVEKVRQEAHWDVRRAFFGVEEVRSTDWTEPEDELCALVAGADIFGCGANDFVGSDEACQGGEYAAGSPLAGKAVANACSYRLALDFNAQLTAGAGGCSLDPSAVRRRLGIHSARPS